MMFQGVKPAAAAPPTQAADKPAAAAPPTQAAENSRKPAAAAPPTQGAAVPPTQQNAASAPTQPQGAANAPGQGVRQGNAFQPNQPNGVAAGGVQPNNNNNGNLVLPNGQKAGAPVSALFHQLYSCAWILAKPSRNRMGRVHCRAGVKTGREGLSCSCLCRLQGMQLWSRPSHPHHPPSPSAHPPRHPPQAPAPPGPHLPRCFTIDIWLAVLIILWDCWGQSSGLLQHAPELCWYKLFV